MGLLYEKKTQPISIGKATRLHSIPHLHKEIEVVYVLEGSTYATADNERFEIKTGDIFFTFPNQVHHYQDIAPTGKYLLLIVSPDILYGIKSEILKSIPSTNIIHAGSAPKAVEYLEDMHNDNHNYHTTALTGFFNLFMCEILQDLELKRSTNSVNSTLREIFNYSNEHYQEKITLDSISKALHLSKYYISRLFNQKLNLNFSEYINALRVNEACSLLSKTDDKISDIAVNVGFGTIRSFNKVFQDFHKTTPQEYRIKHNKNK